MHTHAQSAHRGSKYRRKRPVGLLALVLVGALGATATASAAEEPACLAARYRETGAHLREGVLCSLGDPAAEASCRDASQALLAIRLAAIDARRPCSLFAEAVEIAALVSRALDVDLPDLVGLPDTISRCARLRWLAVARFAVRGLKAHAESVRHPEAARLEAALSRLGDALERRLNRAAESGDCLGAEPDAASISEFLTGLVEGGPRCGDGLAESGEECDETDVAGCDVDLGFPQCGAPGESDACRCRYLPLVGEGVCPSPQPCPPPQTCAIVAFLPQPVRLFHTCIAPEPSSCGGPDQCTLPAATCDGGTCCATAGGVCDGAHPCCDGLRCAGFCCRDALEPCRRNEDCCHGVCEIGGDGAGRCAFF
jgi:hypothetical protein